MTESRLHIVADRNIPAVEETFGHWGTVQSVEGRSLQAADLEDADVLLVRSVTPVNEQLLADTPVRFVGTATAGLDHVDTAWLAARGIAFAAAPGANANSVVEYVLAVIAGVDDVLERLLAGGRVGIVGYGHVGRSLAQRLGAVGIASLQYDPWLDADTLPEPAALAEVLDCSVVSLHTSLTRAPPWPSYHLLAAPELATMDAKTLLINASRGPVIDNTALLARLQQSQPPRCALDVWEAEPLVPPALLAAARYGTAHIAGYSHDAKLAATRMLAEALATRFNLGEPGAGSIEPAASLSIPAELAGGALLRFLWQARYDLAADDKRLREAVLGASAADAMRGFDALRRNYPQRRELAGSTVLISNENQVALAEATGAMVERVG
ncbi:hypothetical protein CWI75_07775 [Kineobactrum sediminis]|uniref:Erythronate-4-phosphate dehydrogenase n=1 Tax=Kineobactrum sediminis TaxID=1905677 RepID=A0A2N5Y4I7_9GAMM|nr:4-phosphoerythronate dehydrogenase [Kineobactrum sediminis]PLW83291.1 hypothetical protein CWI75_07775 [Kineobactrum sediminis]